MSSTISVTMLVFDISSIPCSIVPVATVDEAKQDCFTFYDEMRREYPADRLPDLEVEWVYDLARTRSDADLVDAAVMA